MQNSRIQYGLSEDRFLLQARDLNIAPGLPYSSSSSRIHFTVQRMSRFKSFIQNLWCAVQCNLYGMGILVRTWTPRRRGNSNDWIVWRTLRTLQFYLVCLVLPIQIATIQHRPLVALWPYTFTPIGTAIAAMVTHNFLGYRFVPLWADGILNLTATLQDISLDAQQIHLRRHCGNGFGSLWDRSCMRNQVRNIFGMVNIMIFINVVRAWMIKEWDYNP